MAGSRPLSGILGAPLIAAEAIRRPWELNPGGLPGRTHRTIALTTELRELCYTGRLDAVGSAAADSGSHE